MVKTVKSLSRQRGDITAASGVELFDKIYRLNGWQRQAGESRLHRAAEMYEIGVDRAKNLFIARRRSPKSVDER